MSGPLDPFELGLGGGGSGDAINVSASAGLFGLWGLWGISPQGVLVQVSVSTSSGGPLPLGAPLLYNEHTAIYAFGGLTILVPVSGDPWQQVATDGNPWSKIPTFGGQQSGAPLLIMAHRAIITPEGSILIPVSGDSWQQLAVAGNTWTKVETK